LTSSLTADKYEVADGIADKANCQLDAGKERVEKCAKPAGADRAKRRRKRPKPKRAKPRSDRHSRPTHNVGSGVRPSPHAPDSPLV